MIHRIKRKLKQIISINENKGIVSDDFKYLKSGIDSFLSGLRLNFHGKKEERIYVTIGDNCIINAIVNFETERGNLLIGNRTYIGGANIISRNSVEIGDDVIMAWDITIYDHDSHSLDWTFRQSDIPNCIKALKTGQSLISTKDWTDVKDEPIKIGNKVWIGFGATILKGVTVGEGAVIGAKSVVAKDVLAWTVVAGNPARIIKTLKEK